VSRGFYDRFPLGLNALQDWSNKWLLKLNILKCKTLRSPQADMVRNVINRPDGLINCPDDLLIRPDNLLIRLDRLINRLDDLLIRPDGLLLITIEYHS